MKRLLLLMAFIAFAFILKAQTTLYEDDFESYTVGQGLAAQSPWWILWPNMPDAPVVTEQALSGEKSVKFEGTNDVVLVMGKVSGKYQVDFHYYVPSGFAGYFNFQRLPQPGVEWVAEVYFANNGNGFVHANGQNAATFTYPQNQWIHIKNIIDIDEDVAELYIQNNLIHTWQWSRTSQGAASPHGGQLGGLNVFSGAPTGQIPTFYLDDISFIELATQVVPEIVVSPESFQKDLVAGQMLTDNLNVQNVGQALLNYNLEVNYIFDASKNRPVIQVPEFSGTPIKDLANSIVADPNVKPATQPAPQPEQVYLNYDGPNFTGIGLNAPNEWEVAARFTNNLTVPHAGMEITEVEVYINHTENCSFQLRIYGEGTAFQPGDLLHSQNFVPTVIGWYTIYLTSPVLITGEEVWVGYWIDQTLASIYPAGADGGPAHPNGDFIKTGAGWSHLAPTLDYNWNIRAKLEGDTAPNWLTLSPASGSLQGSQSLAHNVAFNGSILFEGDYEAVIKVKSNDPENPLVIVPVEVSVTGSPEQPSISVNPASLMQELLAGQTATQELTVGNVGQMPLNYSVEIDFMDKGGYTIYPVPDGEIIHKDIDLSLSPNATNGGNPETSPKNDPVVLNYDGPNNDAIGLTAGGTFHVAARFPSAMVAPYANYTLETVDVYINDVPSNATLKVWGAGTSTAPGAVLLQQVFTPLADSWLTITLNTPITLDGTDIWIGYSVTHGASEFPAGCDAGPANPNGDWISTDGNTWQHLAGFGLNYNWNIRGTIFPGEIPWLSVNPESGTVPGSSSDMLNVIFNAFSLDIGTYNANILVSSNDPDNPVVTVPVELAITGAPSQPTITVDPEEMSELLPLGQSSEQTLTIGNVGMQSLSFSIDIALDQKNTIPHRIVPKGELGNFELDIATANAVTGGGQPQERGAKDGVILNYDGPNNDAIGLTGGGTLYSAARFPAAMVAPYAYYTLETVEVYINDVPSNATLRIWGAGTTTAPGALLHQQVFTPMADNWHTVTLSTPVMLDGNDIWIGYSATHGPSEFPSGTDAGPANPDGDWVSTNGTTWQHLAGFGLNYNWNIRGTIFPGTAPWLSASPISGTIAGGGSMPITIGFDAANLGFGMYTAEIQISSNDPATPVKIVPVQLTIEGTPELPEIVVNPMELNQALLEGDAASQELAIGNVGTVNLNYTAEIQYTMNASKDAVVFFEGFEGAAFPPAGWMKLNPIGGTGWTQLAAGTTPLPGWTGGTATPAPDGGDKMAYCTYETGGATANDQWLVTPQLTMAAGMELSFHMRYWPTSFVDRVQIKISTTAQNNPNAFTIMVDDLIFDATSPDTWQLYSYNLDEFLTPGTNFYIGFREFVADNFNDGAAIFLDNVAVTLDLDWLSISPTQGMVVPEGEDILTVSFDSDGLDLGDYSANIRILSNDPANPVVVIPVTMSVVDIIIIPGDANCDGIVNVNDVVVTLGYILFQNPEPFCFENADINGDGIINIADVVGIINIVLGNKSAFVPGLNSSSAHIFLNQHSIELQSDGTLSGLQFEISGADMDQMNLALEGYEFVGANKDGVFTGLIFSMDNTPIPAGKITLFNLTSSNNVSWGEVVAANVNADQVEVLKYQENALITTEEFILSVFPNPAKDHLNIQANQMIDLIRLTNQLGQVVEERILQLQNTVINTSNLRKGIYFLEVHTSDNISIEKIVIE